MTHDPIGDSDTLTRHMACDEVGLDKQFGVWTLGFARTDPSGDIAEFITLQSPGDEDDDWGPYFEVDDQLHGGYNLVRKITVGDGRLELGLTTGLGHDAAKRIVLTFDNTSDNRATVSRRLKLVFRDQLDTLSTERN